MNDEQSEFKGLEWYFGNRPKPSPFDMYLENVIMRALDVCTTIPGTLISVKVQYEDAWYQVESYDPVSNQLHMVPITNAPMLSSMKDNSPALGGDRRQK